MNKWCNNKKCSLKRTFGFSVGKLLYLKLKQYGLEDLGKVWWGRNHSKLWKIITKELNF